MSKLEKYKKKVDKIIKKIELYLKNTNKQDYNYYYLVCVYNKINNYNNMIKLYSNNET